MEKGVVQRVDERFAYITMRLEGGCKTCVNKALCFAGDKPIPLKIENALDLNKGDIVEFDIKPAKKIISGFLLFILPIFNLIAGYYLGAYYGKSEVSGIIGSFIGILVSGIELISINKIIEKNRSLIPQNIRKVESTSLDNLSCDT
ncbi:MAG: hypothetical protein CR982_06110 [Candidatus Cloacimonadota bacterium]|nr:MAG: hypothetical protein CR982_06110 [Candidatus Cloacimonadota bacterium]PIE78094.1 MAG: hypothetical protein CSA15_09670 [Candidatus Delongbacteria bacterium]